MSDTARFFHPEVLGKISRLELRARRVVEGFVSGMHKSPYKGVSVEFANHRPYVAGDDIRHIDWRVYAKSDRHFIKEHEEETNLRTHVLLDCSGSMAYPEHEHDGRMNKWDYASTLAASLAYLLNRQQDAVGLSLFDHEIKAQLPVSSNRIVLSDLANMIQAAAPAEATELATLFPELAGRMGRRSMVVILSDLLADVDVITQGLQRFAHSGHDVLVLHVLDHDELEFPFADRTLFEGLEAADVEIMTDPQSLRSSYLEALSGFLDRIRRACLDHNIDYALVSTAERVDVALTRFIARRMHVRR